MDRRTALRQIGSATAALGLAGCSGPAEDPTNGTANGTATTGRSTSTTERATETSTSTDTETDSPTETDTRTAEGTESPTAEETDSPTPEEADSPTPEDTESPTPEETDSSSESTYYEFEGELSGWYGREPASIQGEEDPRITLHPGVTYEITWINGDGEGHRFAIEDTRGNKLVQSGDSSEEGARRTMNFEATEEMAEYYCTFHTSTMRGDVRTGN